MKFITNASLKAQASNETNEPGSQFCSKQWWYQNGPMFGLARLRAETHKTTALSSTRRLRGPEPKAGAVSPRADSRKVEILLALGCSEAMGVLRHVRLSISIDGRVAGAELEIVQRNCRSDVLLRSKVLRLVVP